MSLDLPLAQLARSDLASSQLQEFGNSLKWVNEEHAWFYQVVFELIDATLTNYRHLKQGYETHDSPLLAWACRNLLELDVFMKYVLVSEENARRFTHDRLIDGCDIIIALKALELHVDPKSDTTPLDDAMNRMQAQMALEHVAATKFLHTGSLAEIVGMKEEFDRINRVCSKLVHPTAWSILAVNKGDDAFSQSRPLLFTLGVGYLCDLFLAAKEHHATHGMLPKPRN
jgi:hypothetical protein